MMFMFFALWMFVRYVKERKLMRKLIFGALSGAAVGFMGLIWGGVGFVFLTVGAFVILNVLFDKFEEKDFYGYTSFLIFYFFQ